MKKWVVLSFVCLATLSCSKDAAKSDAGPDTEEGTDTVGDSEQPEGDSESGSDTTSEDTNSPDTGSTDPGSTDPGSTDTGSPDTGSEDPGGTDPDSTNPDSTDTGSPDTATVDSEVAETDGTDTGESDTQESETDDTGNDSDSATDTPVSCEPGCLSDCPQGCFDMGTCSGGSLDTHPNIRTVGLIAADGGDSLEAEVYYRRPGDSFWMKGNPAVRLPDGRLAGSLFYLSPEQEVEIMVISSEATACGTTRTLAEIPPYETIETLYVDADAPAGGDGGSAAPLPTIQAAVDIAGAGTDIVISAGIYTEEVSITQGGEEGRYLRILGEEGAVLDGSDQEILAGGASFTDEGESVYSMPFTGSPTYLSRDGNRFYHYTSLDGLTSGLGDDDVPMDEGWFVEEGTLYIRCLDDPEGHSWEIPRLTTAIGLDGASWVWVEGLEIRHYGEGEYPKGIDIRDSYHIVVRRNHVHATPSPIWARNGSDYVRIEENDIYQTGMDDWPWDAVKGTDHENSGITVAGAGHTIVRGNRIGHIFNGIYTGSFEDDQNPDIAFDVDVYDNRLGHIGDDGMEPEGACINNRFWNNTVDTLRNGLSLAPITYGPVFALRNRFTDYEESGIKVSNDSSGRVFLYHNTCYTDRPDHNGMNVSGPFENMVFRNNIIRGTRYAFEMSQAALPNDLDYDNFFTTRGAPVMKWDDVRYDTLADMCDATDLECHGQPDDPALIDPATGLFGLTEASPNVDRGLRLYGINDDYAGETPDLGYRERGADEPPLFEP